MIFETHAHYDDEAFDEDRELLLSSMRQNDIEYIVNVGSNLKSTQQSIALADKYPFIYAAAGVHPNETAELDDEKFTQLHKLCQNRKVVAVGETGLDYYWDEPSRDVQKYWFERQIKLAAELKKPLIIHSRDAAQDTYEIMKSNNASEIGGVIHCYSYSAELALEFVRMGFYIGIGGVVTFKNGKKMKETVEAVPIEKILLETDSPYLAPEPNRGKRNSSLNIPFIAQKIAEIKGISYEDTIRITSENAKRMYRIDQE